MLGGRFIKDVTDVVALVFAAAYCLVGMVLGISGHLTETALRILVGVGLIAGFVILRLLRKRQR